MALHNLFSGRRLLSVLSIVVPLGTASIAAAQQVTNRPELLRLERQLEARRVAQKTALYNALLRGDDPAQRILNRDPGIQLMFIRATGVPAFYQTSNYNAARTIGTFEAWPMGSSGHNLTGAGTALGDLAIWDAGWPRTTHVEFGGRVTVMDATSGIHFHASHVAGTMVAAGVDTSARGMSYEAQLASYDWFSDFTEMAAAAANGLHISNHSYGYVAGWRYSPSDTAWFWYGDMGISTVEDFGFGFYDGDSQALDDISYNAPEYLIVKSAGNDRDDDGPTQGGGHFHWDGVGWVWDTDIHNADGASGGYDTVGWLGNAKNILTVGAVHDIPGGYTAPGDVAQAAFSSWGPCDDGRIKPDVVANGISLTSTGYTTDTEYLSFSGTSMASPNASGSANLLRQFYEDTFSAAPRSATIKALIINTADEAGPDPGPDYMNGWGLMNTARAADVIAATFPNDFMGLEEAVIRDGDTMYHYFEADSTDDIQVTIVWTDPSGTPASPSVDPVTPMLVNDLDMRLERITIPAGTYQPWILDPSAPANAATAGDNTRDNAEQIFAASTGYGEFRVAVTHKSTLADAPQAYSLVWRGMRAVAPTAVNDGPATPPRLSIHALYPNPASGITRIRYRIDQAGPVTITVYDVRGRRVATLLDGQVKPAGAGKVEFNTERLPQGMYFVRLETTFSSASRKIAVIR